MNYFAKRVTDLVPNQVHRKAIEVDAYLRVKGTAPGTVYAVGDCATVSARPCANAKGSLTIRGCCVKVETSVVSHLLELVKEADRNEDGRIDYDEWMTMGETQWSSIYERLSRES